MSNHLEGEPVKHSSLIEDTRAAIADVAKHGYKELNKLSPAKHSPLNLPNSGLYGTDKRFFMDRRIVRAAELPNEPVVIEDRDITVMQTATETFRRQHEFENKVTLPLPARKKLVTVQYSLPNDEKLVVPHEVSISTMGYAPTDSAYSGPYQDQLAITGFIAESLSRAHGIKTDTKELYKLQQAWGKFRTGEMHPDIAVLLPKKV